jgi:hypothetical protein
MFNRLDSCHSYKTLDSDEDLQVEASVGRGLAQSASAQAVLRLARQILDTDPASDSIKDGAELMSFFRFDRPSSGVAPQEKRLIGPSRVKRGVACWERTWSCKHGLSSRSEFLWALWDSGGIDIRKDNFVDLIFFAEETDEAWLRWRLLEALKAYLLEALDIDEKEEREQEGLALYLSAKLLIGQDLAILQELEKWWREYPLRGREVSEQDKAWLVGLMTEILEEDRPCSHVLERRMNDLSEIEVSSEHTEREGPLIKQKSSSRVSRLFARIKRGTCAL